MDAALLIAAVAAGLGVATALLVRVYAGTSPSTAVGPVGRLAASLGPARRRGATRAGALLVWCASLIAAGWVAGVAVGLVTARSSLGLVDWFAAHRAEPLTATLRVVTWLGDSTVVVPVAVTIGLAWRWRRGDWWAFTLLVVGYLGSATVYSVVKLLVAASRPVGDVVLGAASGAAFPSGHTANATVLCVGSLLVALRTGPGRRHDVPLAVASGVLVALVGLSRVYLGVHWLVDVIGGAVLGALWIAGVAVTTSDRDSEPSSTASGALAPDS